MLSFLLRRVLLTVPILFGVSLVTFMMIHLVPGDPVQIIMGQNPTGAGEAALRHQLGLDAPLPAQYLRFVSGALRGDLGTSIRSGRPVTSEIGDRFPATLELTFAALALAIALGIPAGAVSAATRSRALAGAMTLGATLGISLPTFFLGLLLVDVFALQLRWLPSLSDTSPRGLVLPAVTLAIPAAAVLARVTRSGLSEALRQDYIRTARAKGLAYARIVVAHALRNGLIVVLTIVGLQFGSLMAGSVIVESVFARPGLGSFVVGAIQSRDYPDIQGTVLVFALFYVTINIVLDVLYGLVNPRVRVS